MSKIELNVNGLDYKVDIGLNTTLLEILRDRLCITSPKMGCNVGDCGACSVLLNGKIVRSCLTNGQTCNGKEVITVEGLANPGKLHPLQNAFNEHGASQCGFCTPAMIIASKALLDHTPHPTREEARKGISGHLCRCTGYQKIVDSIIAASQNTNDGNS
jgi:carbon-monoxide dehydrogenase small subunit